MTFVKGLCPLRVMKRPQRTIDQVAFSSLFLTQELTFSDVTNTDKHGKAGRDPVKHPSIRRPVLRWCEPRPTPWR
jgi:hypothetical protein